MKMNNCQIYGQLLPKNICISIEKPYQQNPSLLNFSLPAAVLFCVWEVGGDGVAQLFCQRNGFTVMDGISGTVQVSACC